MFGHSDRYSLRQEAQGTVRTSLNARAMRPPTGVAPFWTTARRARSPKDGVEEPSPVHGRAELAHAAGEDPVEGVELLSPAPFDGKARPLGLSDLVPHTAIELLPQAVRVGREGQGEVDLVVQGL
jgi:hypothetical protein